ncbi:UNVERIFIED_CONTAM: hypothetical protein FKN15_063663 [Acipenser sinensis]
MASPSRSSQNRRRCKEPMRYSYNPEQFHNVGVRNQTHEAITMPRSNSDTDLVTSDSRSTLMVSNSYYAIGQSQNIVICWDIKEEVDAGDWIGMYLVDEVLSENFLDYKNRGVNGSHKGQIVWKIVASSYFVELVLPVACTGGHPCMLLPVENANQNRGYRTSADLVPCLYCTIPYRPGAKVTEPSSIVQVPTCYHTVQTCALSPPPSVNEVNASSPHGSVPGETGRRTRESSPCSLLVEQPACLRLGVALGSVTRREVVTTDASSLGWGALRNGSGVQGVWNPPWQGLHINVLELQAVYLALQNFLQVVQGRQVLVRTDNTLLRLKDIRVPKYLNDWLICAQSPA